MWFGPVLATPRRQLKDVTLHLTTPRTWYNASSERGTWTGEVRTGRTEGKIPLGIPRLRWEDNIKIDVQEV